jgi:transposase-like protein
MDNWKTVMSFTNSHDAHIVKGYLELNGIETNIKDELTAQVLYLSKTVGGVKILVKDHDYEVSIQLLKGGGYLTDDNSTIENKMEIILSDNTTNKNICPFCSSENIVRHKEPNFWTIMGYFTIGTIFPVFRSTYKCFDCEKKWKYKRSKALLKNKLYYIP